VERSTGGDPRGEKSATGQYGGNSGKTIEEAIRRARGCVFRGAAARLAAGKSGAVFRLLWPIPELSRRSARGGP
jgi:hypothetical protein